MVEWFSIEVLDGSFQARSWRESHGDSLIWAAQLEGAVDWVWEEHPWGVILELAFPDEAAWERFRESLAAQTALDAVPDPVSGLIVHRGRGGSAGSRTPRRPRPFAGAGAMALPIPEELEPDVAPSRPRVLLAAR